MEVQGGKRKAQSCVEGTLVGQLLVVVSVQDPDFNRSDAKGDPVRYTGALIDASKWRRNGEPHEAERVSRGRWPDSRRLGSRQLWDLPTIRRSAHVVPTDDQDSTFYINNYIDCEMYNTLYHDDWETIGTRQADKTAKMIAIERESRRRQEEEYEEQIGRRRGGSLYISNTAYGRIYIFRLFIFN
jgi:hypothetical protein